MTVSGPIEAACLVAVVAIVIGTSLIRASAPSAWARLTSALRNDSSLRFELRTRIRANSIWGCAGSWSSHSI